MMRCAERGCIVPDEAHASELCPSCGNPLQLVEHPEQAAEVSQEKLDGIEAPDFPEMVAALLHELHTARFVIVSYSTIGAAPLNVDVPQFLADTEELMEQIETNRTPT